MKETHFFFRNVSYDLFGVLHEPENQLKRMGYVFIYPFAEEQLWSHRVFVNFARELSLLGYHVLRFDFMGHGDSEGSFDESTIGTRLLDIKRAITTLKERSSSVKEIGLLGLRFGATLASIAAEQLPDINKLILWEPIINGSKYMQEILRSNLATQNAVFKEIRHNRNDLIQIMKDGKTINSDGYEISYNLYDQISSINILHYKKKFDGKCLIIQISRKEKKIRKELEQFKASYSKAELIISVEEPFWKEIKIFYSRADNLYKDTMKWLGANND